MTSYLLCMALGMSPVSSDYTPLDEEIDSIVVSGKCQHLSQDEIDKKVAAAKKAREIPSCRVKFLSDFEGKIYNLPSRMAIGTKRGRREIEYDLNLPTKDFTQVQRVVALSATGRKILRQMGAHRGEFKIQFIPDRRMKQSTFAAYFDPETKTVYLNQNAPLGLLAVAFVHEVTHALDTSAMSSMQQCQIHFVEAFKSFYPKVYRVLKKSAAGREVSLDSILDNDFVSEEFISEHYKKCTSVPDYLTERKAYDAQHRFIEEMRSRVKCYGPFIDAQDKNAKIVSGTYSDREIMKRYPAFIIPRVVEDYLSQAHITPTEPKSQPPMSQCEIQELLNRFLPARK